MIDFTLLLNDFAPAAETVNEVVEWEDNFRFLGIKLINIEDFFELLIRFTFNSTLIFFVIHFLYARTSKRKDYYFSYIAIGAIVFLLSFLLNNVKLELGFALGLFAIFGIIRYRTDAIPIKEMTYLFIIIGISVINALANKKVSYAELIFTNAAIVLCLWFLENRLALRQELTMRLTYEKIENIHTLSQEVMLKDLSERTGINITRYEIKKIDFLRDIAEIDLFYNANGGHGYDQK